MKATHTPGPWWVGHDDATSVFAEVADQQAERIAITGHQSFSLDEMLANARLIAAAPDLLAVLEAIVSDAEKAMHPPSRMFGCEAAKAAIAKARGE